jgi:hypothetical protein
MKTTKCLVCDKCEKQVWDGIEVRNTHFDVLPIGVWKFSLFYIHNSNQSCRCVKENFDYFFNYGPCVFYYYLFDCFLSCIFIYETCRTKVWNIVHVNDPHFVCIYFWKGLITFKCEEMNN